MAPGGALFHSANGTNGTGRKWHLVVRYSIALMAPIPPLSSWCKATQCIALCSITMQSDIIGTEEMCKGKNGNPGALLKNFSRFMVSGVP